MLKALQHFNKKHALFTTDTDKLLLAVSGGVDSMVMLFLFQQIDVPVAVAHCNFKLRGKDSDGDQKMVKEYCEQHHIKFLSKTFETQSFAKDQGISIEMAARELRYAWFDQMYQQHEFTKIATAHHSGDALETIIYNLAKGTGINGLIGIKPKRNNIIRPLLFTNREKIEAYALENNIPWRTDASNFDNIYHRNRIRNEVLPHLQKINTNLEETILFTLERMRAAADIFQEQVDEFYQKAIESTSEGININKSTLLNNRHALVFLTEILTHYKFNYHQVRQIENALTGTPGKVFYSKSHQLTIDRKWVFIDQKKNKTKNIYTITDTTQQLEMQDGTLKVERKARENFTLSRQVNVAAMDLDKIGFPITVRRWRHGDKFKPLGMQGSKLVSDFLIDHKIPVNLKNEIYLLESKNQVVWIVNYRLDDRFKITENTSTILEITFLPHDQPI